jgi:hypothetical protein
MRKLIYKPTDCVYELITKPKHMIRVMHLLKMFQNLNTWEQMAFNLELRGKLILEAFVVTLDSIVAFPTFKSTED